MVPTTIGTPAIPEETLTITRTTPTVTIATTATEIHPTPEIPVATTQIVQVAMGHLVAEALAEATEAAAVAAEVAGAADNNINFEST